MNRTEHRLRMSFDPEYERKWVILSDNRKSRKRVIINSLKSLGKGLIGSVLISNLVYTVTGTWQWSIIPPVIVTSIFIIFSLWYYYGIDYIIRKDLGI